MPGTATLSSLWSISFSPIQKGFHESLLVNQLYCWLSEVMAEKWALVTRRCHSAARTLHCRGSPHSDLFKPTASINRYRNSSSAGHFFFLPFPCSLIQAKTKISLVACKLLRFWNGNAVLLKGVIAGFLIVKIFH